MENKETAAILQATVCIGEQDTFDVEEKSHLNYDLFLAHREEILARKDLTHQLWLMMKEENVKEYIFFNIFSVTIGKYRVLKGSFKVLTAKC